MTTNQCPLIAGCVKQLKLQMHHGFFEDIDTDELEFAAQRANFTPEYVRLRAFFLVEEMLAFIKGRYQVFKTAAIPDFDIELKAKSWSELTRVKGDLEKLQHECERELADYALDDRTVDGEMVVLHFKDKGDTSIKPTRAYEDSNRIRLAKQIIKLSETTVHAIRAFRPYLRSDEGQSLKTVSDSLAHVLREIYGMTAGSHLNTFIHKLISMRM